MTIEILPNNRSIPETKRCPRCRKTKAASAFGVHYKQKKLRAYCRICDARYQAERRRNGYRSPSDAYRKRSPQAERKAKRKYDRTRLGKITKTVYLQRRKIKRHKAEAIVCSRLIDDLLEERRKIRAGEAT